MTDATYLNGLTEEQRAIVLAPTDRPILVNATAGSGKTHTIAVRAAHLIDGLGIKPERILLTTFTRAAAKEIVERTAKFVGDDAHSIWSGTIHSVCLQILRDELRRVDVLSNRDHTIILSKAAEAALKSHDIDPRDARFLGPKYWTQWIDLIKLEYNPDAGSKMMFILDHMEKSRPFAPYNDVLADVAVEVFDRYERGKGQQIDFTDMLVRVTDLFSNPIIRTRWNHRLDYAMVDEAQDTSSIQNRIIKTLSGDRLFTVGDADQALYNFRGATPEENVFNFLNRFPNGAVYPLSINWRSTPAIIDASNTLLNPAYEAEDRKQYRKSVVPREENWKALGPAAVRVDSYQDADTEAQTVAEEIKIEIETAGAVPADYYVIVRTNAQTQPFEDALVSRGIMVVNKSGSFFNRRRIMDCISLVQLALHREDNASFMRVYDIPSPDFNKTTRYLGKRFIADLQDKSFEYGKDTTLWDGLVKSYQDRFWPFRRQESIADFIHYMDRISLEHEDGATPSQLLETVTGHYGQWVMKRDGLLEELEDLEQLVVVGSRFEQWDKFMAFVTKMQSMVSADPEIERKAVVLTTVHGVKGLERKVVYAAGVSDGFLPHWQSVDMPIAIVSQDGNVSIRTRGDGHPSAYNGTELDERCVAFVMFTRAREVLRVSWARQIGNKVALEPSRFIEQSGLEAPELAWIEDGVARSVRANGGEEVSVTGWAQVRDMLSDLRSSIGGLLKIGKANGG